MEQSDQGLQCLHINKKFIIKKQLIGLNLGMKRSSQKLVGSGGNNYGVPIHQILRQGDF